MDADGVNLPKQNPDVQIHSCVCACFGVYSVTYISIIVTAPVQSALCPFMDVRCTTSLDLSISAAEDEERSCDAAGKAAGGKGEGMGHH